MCTGICYHLTYWENGCVLSDLINKSDLEIGVGGTRAGQHSFKLHIKRSRCLSNGN